MAFSEQAHLELPIHPLDLWLDEERAGELIGDIVIGRQAIAGTYDRTLVEFWVPELTGKLQGEANAA